MLDMLDMLDELTEHLTSSCASKKIYIHSDSLKHMEFPISAGSIFSSAIEAFAIASQSPFGWMNRKEHTLTV